MSLEAAEFFWLCVSAYLGLGAIFGLLTAVWGVARLDHAGAGSSLAFRVLALPGFIVMWPALLVRYLSFRRINADPHGATAEEGAS